MNDRTPEQRAELREAVNTLRRFADLPPLVDPAFGEEVRRLRIERSVSLRTLAERASVSPTLVSKVENGHIAPPSESAIRRIAHTLEADEYELLKLAGKLPTELVASLLQKPVEEWRRLL